MKSKGLTLTELIVTMVITGIIGLTIVAHFTAARRFHLATEDRIANSREVRIAMDHMTRVLRFADPATVTVDVPDSRYIAATIRGGHLDFIPNDTLVRYRYLPASNGLRYVQGRTQFLIAKNITYFLGTYDSVNSELTINLTAGDGNESVSLETTIRIIGE